MAGLPPGASVRQGCALEVVCADLVCGRAPFWGEDRADGLEFEREGMGNGLVLSRDGAGA